MIHDIGKAAGDIWHLLKEEGVQPLSQIKSTLKIKDPMLYMAIGWLAREDQLSFTQEGRVTKLSIKEH